MITHDKLLNILKRVEFRNWNFRITTYGRLGNGFLIHLVFTCDLTGEIQHGRKWYISEHATESEVIHTAFKAVITAMEHEVREQFTVDGKPIFHPHHSIDSLLSIADAVDVRPEVPA